MTIKQVKELLLGITMYRGDTCYLLTTDSSEGDYSSKLSLVIHETGVIRGLRTIGSYENHAGYATARVPENEEEKVIEILIEKCDINALGQAVMDLIVQSELI